MIDSTDTQQLSSARSQVAVAEPLAGMLVAGYIVLAFPNDDNRSAMYGSFDTVDDALVWAEQLSGIVTVMPIYSPTHNRG